MSIGLVLGALALGALYLASLAAEDKDRRGEANHAALDIVRRSNG